MPFLRHRRAARFLAVASILLAGSTAAQEPQLARTDSPWAGAIGLNLAYRPEYDGGARHQIKPTPALYLRYGRFSFSSGASYAIRSTDESVRGLGIDLVRGTRTRIGLSLRYDSGRRESSSEDLKGMGDVKPTLRLRIGATRQLDENWGVRASWTIDAFGRGGGNFGDMAASWSHAIAPRTIFSASTTLTLGGDRYLQSYYGVTPEQSAASGYPVYEPQFGLRDVSVGVGIRTDLGEHWSTIAGVGVSRLLGPAAASPLTRERNSWGANVGLAWRF